MERSHVRRPAPADHDEPFGFASSRHARSTLRWGAGAGSIAFPVTDGKMRDDLESRAIRFLNRAEVPSDNRELRFYGEGRYPRRVWELEVSLSHSRLDEEAEATLVESFHQLHDERYGFRMNEQPVEFLHWRVEAFDAAPGSRPDSRRRVLRSSIRRRRRSSSPRARPCG